MIDDFLATYFSQANYSKLEWQKVEENIFSNNSDEAIEPFKEFFTDTVLEKLTKSRVLPSFYLRDMELTYKVSGFEKSDDGLIANLILTSTDKNIDCKLKFQFENGKIYWFDYATIMKNIQQLKKQSV
ncbi:hypothetical protein SAMN00017477_0249 [Peptoniphilus asaccharolyticus DSM 20463]|uniref:Uncharacterized protein n=1 Tax=Peptoniphilus asaccharolyticus DSM 20463 TaxID=573058 RepID=A0A1W1UHI1_PEPAS|nr:hypothetical protein [Peptoniphilus asaccharolyticus]MBL7574732.1 hypothetical protein [Peptoniphilus asaccharolyticus]SMB80556.1 hypothetical protein SAMN00017477_0249 [Peptoniphilus asaccharolyticus DSM 20463]